ncbi:DUF6970 domain-containing protein [Nibrella viscosa]|uniref:DUF6970 domain-containing protein n=1 Tax=Nibrella viscosa TaxID=1084524 RepID=UPI0031E80CE3
MRRFTRYLVFVSLLAFGCKKENILEGTPACIVDKINQIKQEAVWNPPAKVFRYEYKGQTVYYIPPRCCDVPSTLLDAQCNYLCAPDGGIDGKGDGKCSDFFNARSGETLVWADSRRN